MPIDLFWGDPQQTILHCRFGETWTLDDYFAAIDAMYDMINSVQHRVHTISDFSGSRSSPARLLSAAAHIENRRAVNSGIHIVVGASTFIKSMLKAAQRMYLSDLQIYMVGSLEEAYQLIEQRQRQISTER